MGATSDSGFFFGVVACFLGVFFGEAAGAFFEFFLGDDLEGDTDGFFAPPEDRDLDRSFGVAGEAEGFGDAAFTGDADLALLADFFFPVEPFFDFFDCDVDLRFEGVAAGDSVAACADGRPSLGEGAATACVVLARTGVRALAGDASSRGRFAGDAAGDAAAASTSRARAMTSSVLAETAGAVGTLVATAFAA